MLSWCPALVGRKLARVKHFQHELYSTQRALRVVCAVKNDQAKAELPPATTSTEVCIATPGGQACAAPDAASISAREEESFAPIPFLLLLAPFFFWGTAMVAIKLALPETSSLFVASVRLIPSGLLLVAFGALRGEAQPSGTKAWAALTLFGLVDGTAFQGCRAYCCARRERELRSSRSPSYIPG